MAKMSSPSDGAPPPALKFPKPSTLTQLPVPGDDNFAAQMVEALKAIQASIASVQTTLDEVIVVLTTEEPEPAGDPQ